MDRDQMGQVVEPLVSFFLRPSLFSLPARVFLGSPPISLNQTSDNSASILSKHIFSCYLSYFFCYKTCTGCLEQQQKYNIQFICNFFHLIIINSLIIHQVNPTGVPLLSDCSESNVPNGPGSIWVSAGVRGTNKYRGQDVMKSKTGIFDTL